MDEEQARIRGYLVAQGAKLSPAAIVEKVQQAMADLKAAAAAVPAARFGERPAPEEWSGNEVMAHVVAADDYFGGGIQRLLAGQSPPPRPGGRGVEGAPLLTAEAWYKALAQQRDAPLHGGAGRRSRGRARPAHRASDVRSAHLAGDAALHPAARSRSRRPAPEDRDGPRGGALRLMRVSISLRLAQTDWAEASRYVTEAERLGVDDVWSAEAWGHDGVTPLAFMAARTSRIRLGTGILQAGTRTPALLAMTAMSLQAMSNGRFVLGLGVSGPQVIEGWHGIRFDRPVQRMRETVEIVRRAVKGERLEYKGKVYELPLPGGEGKALRSAAPPQPTLPIYLATLSPRSLEMTGEIADGWLGTSFMPEHAHVFTDSLAAGRPARAGRSPSSICRRAGSSPSATTWSG